MSEKRSVTLNGLALPNAIYVLVSILMIMVGAYLTNHYFELMYPTGISTGSGLCNINDFWGCDNATKSVMGTLFNVPTSIFAIIIGVCGLFASFTGKEGFERTMRLVLVLNLVACALLLAYSLIALGSLCPMCTVYYVLSAIAYFIFHKWSDYQPGLDMKAFGTFFIILLIPSVTLGYNITSRKNNQIVQAQSFVSQFASLKSYGENSFESPYKLHMATKNFSDAPIRISLYSDFQCPYCQNVATQFQAIIEEFKDHINVEYLFYPLDMTCNKEMKGSLHPYACQASYLAACDETKFAKIHDFIFANQKDINPKNLVKWEKDFGLSGCFKNTDLQDIVQQTLNAGKKYKLKSTPTMVINGKKIEGGLSTPMLRAILKSLIK